MKIGIASLAGIIKIMTERGIRLLAEMEDRGRLFWEAASLNGSDKIFDVKHSWRTLHPLED